MIVPLELPIAVQFSRAVFRVVPNQSGKENKDKVTKRSFSCHRNVLSFIVRYKNRVIYHEKKLSFLKKKSSKNWKRVQTLIVISPKETQFILTRFFSLVHLHFDM